ncbi:MAG: hypothetical protein GY788_23085 [bacterium]|nr:hypothetical protein [bacterium]
MSVSQDASASAIFPALFATEVIVDYAVNGVAARVVSGAPVDPLTGAKVPTVAVATDGGASVIKDNGDIWDITGQAGGMMFADWTEGDEIVIGYNYSSHVRIYTLPASDGAYTSRTREYIGGASSIPALMIDGTNVAGLAVQNDLIYVGKILGLSIVNEDTSNEVKGSVAYLTTSWASGWQRGNIHACVLADTTADRSI